MPLAQLHRATGRCACSRVSYACLIESETAICSCSICRRNSGSAFQAWVNGDRASLRISGETSSWVSSTHAARHFCASCGSALFLFENGEPQIVEVAAGTLDDPHGIVSTRQGRQYLHEWPSWANALAASR